MSEIDSHILKFIEVNFIPLATDDDLWTAKATWDQLEALLTDAKKTIAEYNKSGEKPIYLSKKDNTVVTVFSFDTRHQESVSANVLLEGIQHTSVITIYPSIIADEAWHIIETDNTMNVVVLPEEKVAYCHSELGKDSAFAAKVAVNILSNPEEALADLKKNLTFATGETRHLGLSKDFVDWPVPDAEHFEFKLTKAGLRGLRMIHQQASAGGSGASEDLGDPGTPGDPGCVICRHFYGPVEYNENTGMFTCFVDLIMIKQYC